MIAAKYGDMAIPEQGKNLRIKREIDPLINSEICVTVTTIINCMCR